jgi:hypothetical protein
MTVNSQVWSHVDGEVGIVAWSEVVSQVDGAVWDPVGGIVAEQVKGQLTEDK